MKINVAKSAGFCFGVKRAIDTALKTAASGENVYMLGDIVHNEEVVREISKAGIKKIKTLSSGKNKILLVRAHGACRYILKKAALLGYTIVDATCPMVKEIHRIVKDMEKKGYRIIIIGDQRHDEVHGIAGQLKKNAIVIDDSSRIPLTSIKKIKKACVVVQSTQNLEKVLKLVEILKSHIKDLRFYNTICNPTRIRQEEIKKMPLENDVMIVIGSKNSANTKRLYEISQSLNPRSHWIGSKKDLQKAWFKNARSVGITAGASTPHATLQEVIASIKTLTCTHSSR